MTAPVAATRPRMYAQAKRVQARAYEDVNREGGRAHVHLQTP